MSKLGRDVFISLAAIGWADGKLDPDEADAIVRAALDEGLTLDEINEIEAATKAPVTLDFIDRSFMGKDDRLFVYAMATWIARIDGKITTEEVEALSSLGDLLGVPARPRKAAEVLVEEIAAEGDKPYRYDLARLKKTITERLLEAERARLESR
jgi:tellurite resistance protein